MALLLLLVRNMFVQLLAITNCCASIVDKFWGNRAHPISAEPCVWKGTSRHTIQYMYVEKVDTLHGIYCHMFTVKIT